MFDKILIANRGEIACRIIRTAHNLGIQCVAVYSETDSNALHVKLADEAYLIGPAPSRDSYLNIQKILDAAKQSSAKAIHPGYGFLSENAELAAACEHAGIVFIGPSSNAISLMGSKTVAKQLMEKANVPLIPGYHGNDQDLKTLIHQAERIGYPVILKAAAGGGGKGMRVVTKSTELEPAIAAAKRESLASFGDDALLVEKYLAKARHVEIQIFADTHGEIVYLFERDCSLQRRHQKIIEEAPAPGMTEDLRARMGNAAIAAARAIDYVGAGTVEFLLDENQNFYFMEMNTRLQVEHPITEMITGQDLVAWQLQIAQGHRLPLSQKQLCIKGHAFEARIYAEDPLHNFLPSTGKIQHLLTPHENQHVRIDTGVVQGDSVSIYYDPMIAKLVVWDVDRNSSLQQLRNALAEYVITGVTTNVDFLSTIACHPAFAAAHIDTDFIPRHHDELFMPPKTFSPHIYAIASLYLLLTQKQCAKAPLKLSSTPASPWQTTDGWRLNLHGHQTLYFTQDKKEITVVITYLSTGYEIAISDHASFHLDGELLEKYKLRCDINGEQCHAIVVAHDNLLIVSTGNKQYTLHRKILATLHDEDDSASSHLVAPMPGTIVALLAKPGDTLEKGAGMLVMEAMKMEHTLYAPSIGTIKEFYFKVGDLVKEGTKLLEFESVNDEK